MENGITKETFFAGLPEVAVFYSGGRSSGMFIQAGNPICRPICEGELVANFMAANYDLAGSFVALEILDCDMALQPFVDGVRAGRRRANGVFPPEVAEIYEGSFQSMRPAIPSPEAAKPPPEWDLFDDVPDVVARYTPGTQVLTLQAGLAVEIAESEAVARQLVAHYNAEKSLVALDILDAETTLRPFLDAVLPAEQPQPANPG